uniref:Uncharacterized protein n=1 Tax=Sphaerodactylus townsendi TaxID=933632 RepID=A0ACB8FNT8_9SAUR
MWNHFKTGTHPGFETEDAFIALVAYAETDMSQLCIVLATNLHIQLFQMTTIEFFFLFSKVELAVTSDGKTIVCYHPSVDIPYEHTRPIPQLDPVDFKAETHDQVLKSKLEVEELNNKQGPTIEELSRMFYTTKHRWYPVGQYHTRRKKTNPPKDRRLKLNKWHTYDLEEECEEAFKLLLPVRISRNALYRGSSPSSTLLPVLVKLHFQELPPDEQNGPQMWTGEKFLCEIHGELKVAQLGN